ncbi:MAG: serine hydrolase domain-containing protein [Bacteroidota bacterium]
MNAPPWILASICWLFACHSPEPMMPHLDGTRISAPQLRQEILDLVDRSQTTGLAVSIIGPDRIHFQEAFGWAHRENEDSLSTQHLFNAASFSKAVFGYLSAQMIAEGTLDPDLPLQTYFDQPIPELAFNRDWKGFGALVDDPRYEQITARMCLNHTTGFPNWRWLTKAGDFDREGDIRFQSDPGERYSYSGEGIQLAQYAVEKLADQPLEALAQQRVFQPLGMKQSSYVGVSLTEGRFAYGHDQEQHSKKLDPSDEARAAGSMMTSVADMSLFCQHLLRQYLKKDSAVHVMWTPSVRIRSKAQFGYQSWETTDENDEIALSYGMGWGLLQTPYGPGAFKEGHDDGFQHYMIMFPEAKLGVILMTNSDNGESIFKALLEKTIGDTYTPWKWERYIPFDQEPS